MKMKINKQKLIVILLVAILIVSIPLVTAAPPGTSESAVVEAAKSWVGVKSVPGGNNASGIDCSHLVFQVYKQVGAKNIVFQTVPNMKKNVYYVNTTSPTPGDVIFWKKDVTKNNKTYWLADHVGIYIGNGQLIDTSFDTKVVAIEDISGVYNDGMPYYARWEPDGSGSNLPVAAFSAYPTSGNAPLNVSFTDSSTGATSWSWIFGDGNTSAEKDPTHTYSKAGSYNVNLTVRNENGTDSSFATITVSEQPIPVLPTADFNSNLVSGFAPLEVQFTDASQNATGWKWDFDDGATSNEQSPTHTYFSAGTYNVSLTATNANGSKSQTVIITVQSPSSSDGGSSSGGSNGGSSDESDGGSSHSSSGGGGTGGSPEPQSNVEAKELSQAFIASGQSVEFDFPQKATPVVNISFDSKKTVGKTTTIAEMLKNKSAIASEVPNGEVNKYFNIWVGSGGFGDSNNIENAAVCFKVEKSWIQDKNIDKSSITLSRYNDTKWNELPTNLSGEDDSYLYFTAATPGFSPFAIMGETTANKTVNAIQSENQTGPNIRSLENNTSNTTSAGKIPAQTQSPGTKAPGFEIALGIVCLFGAFLYKRR